MRLGEDHARLPEVPELCGPQGFITRLQPVGERAEDVSYAGDGVMAAEHGGRDAPVVVGLGVILLSSNSLRTD